MSIVVLVFLVSFGTHQISSQYIERYLCMGKCVCLPNEGVVACHGTDNMRALPTNIDKSMTRFIVQNGNFDNPKLYRHNLTGLEHLTFLKIIYYNLRYIGPRAFVLMKKLQYLDLSHNKILNIASLAFSGLSLLELHIMENSNIKFQTNAFHDMTAFTINMRSNNLSDLNYDLVKNTKVKYFYLYNNTIENINPKFQLLFNDSSTLLDVSNNPLICDCSLSWLADVLALRFALEKRLISSKKINISCVKPIELFNRMLMFLRPNDLKCSPLRIESVRLHYDTAVPQLTCVSKIGGSKSPTVTWLYYANKYDNFAIKGSNNFEEILTDKFNSNSLAYTTINLTRNFFKNGISRLICLASADGDLTQRLEVHIHQIRPLITNLSNKTMLISLIPKETGFLFVRHFSILEMLGAVLGTFSATFIGLIVLLRYLKSYQNKLTNKKDFMDHHKNTNSVKPYWYIPRATSSTYSMPNSPGDYENPATLDRHHDLPNMYSSYSVNRSEFLDFKTHNPIGL